MLFFAFVSFRVFFKDLVPSVFSRRSFRLLAFRDGVWIFLNCLSLFTMHPEPPTFEGVTRAIVSSGG